MPYCVKEKADIYWSQTFHREGGDAAQGFLSISMGWGSENLHKNRSDLFTKKV